MLRRIILVVLAFGFAAAGIAFAVGEFSLAYKTGDADHFYAALFGGGLLGFVSVLLMSLGIKAPKPGEPEDAAATVWAVGMGSAMGNSDTDHGT